MRLLKYIPMACAAILLVETPALAQSTLQVSALAFVSSTEGSGGPIDYGNTGYYRARVQVPAGVGNAQNVMFRGVFTPNPALITTPTLNGFSAAAFAGGCVIPDPATPANMNSFQCTLGTLDDGAALVERRPRIRLPAPTNRPATCPAVDTVGTMTVTASATNATSVTVMNAAAETEDFADLDVALSGVPDHAKTGDTITTTVTITNFGPCPVEHTCASENNGTAVEFQSNSGACTKPYGACNLGGVPSLPHYDPTQECGFPQSLSPVPPNFPGYLAVNSRFVFTSTYKVGQIPSSVTNAALPQEVDIQADTWLINYGDHTQAATAQSLWANENSCSVAATGGSSLALLGVALVAARVLSRRRRS